jgi:hypothetical protein
VPADGFGDALRVSGALQQPSTVSRRLSAVVGFYRVCVIDQIPLPPAVARRRPGR